MKAPEGYELGTPYARDKTGVLFRAVQKRLDRPVTLKILREKWRDHPSARRMFVEERSIAASLEQPNLLLTLDTGETDGLPWFVTESTLEPTLHEALRSGLAMTETRAVGIALGCARALVTLDRESLVYKNLCPANVLLPRPAAPKLITFRNVRSIEEAKSFRGSRVQSGAWGAPELVRDDLGPVTIKANIYALGALLYHMLAGAPPVEGGSAEARKKHAAHDLVPLKERKPFLRDRAYATVNRLMALDPRRRPDPGSVVALLEGYLNDPLVTRPPTSRRRRRRKGR